MKITINLDTDDLRIAESIVRNQTHFALNSETLEDAVITGILKQIVAKQNAYNPYYDEDSPIGESI